MWSGAAGSVVDLHPNGFLFSVASGVSGAGQVGAGAGPITGNEQHALLWNGTPESVVDLHPYLTGLDPDFTTSYASGIAANGTIVGLARAGDLNYAVMWTPVPEPSACVLFACGLLGAALFGSGRLFRRRMNGETS
jgi:hypothetical protein